MIVRQVHTMIFDITFILIVGFVGGIVAKRLKQPAVVGYLVSGLIASLFFSHLIQNREAIDGIAQIGVALLLFTLGIELSLTRLKNVLKIAIIGGVLQILFCVVVYQAGLILFGFDPYQALFIAAALSLSSTAVVVKVLGEQGLIESLGGEIMVAWLLIQDLAVVPMVILLPLLKDGISYDILPRLMVPLITAGEFLFVMIYFGKRSVSYILAKIAAYNVQELLLLATVSICLGIAYLTEQIGLSFVFGAFIAGVTIAETTENHAVFNEIRPLRDLFAVVFFVSIALLVPGDVVLRLLPVAVLISVGVMVVKFLVVGGIMYYFGYHSKVSILVAIGMVQVGEFSFLLIREGVRQGLVSENAFSLVLSVSVLTIIMTPILFTGMLTSYKQIQKAIKTHMPTLYPYVFRNGVYAKPFEELAFDNHVVLCGFGRMGRYIGRALESAEIPYVVIEYNRYLVNSLRAAGIHVVYGDPSDRLILDCAQVDHAKLLIIAIPDVHTQRQVIEHSKDLNPEIQIISRIHHEDYQKELKALGADLIVQPEFAAALTVVERVLHLFNVSQDLISGKIARLKIEHGMG